MDRRLVYGGPSPPFFSQEWSMYTECRATLLNSPLLLYFFHGVLSLVACSLVSLRGGAGV